MRFRPGDVVIHRDYPSEPLTVLAVSTVAGMVVVKGDRWIEERKLHHTGMRVVNPR